MSRTLRSNSRMMEYLGARDVRVPWTTADTHSAPKRAFQYGTVICIRVSASVSVGGCAINEYIHVVSVVSRQ